MKRRRNKVYIRKTILIFLVLAIFPLVFTSASADEYKEVFSEIYFGRHPSAKAEALGRSGVAVAPNGFASFYNPALISLCKDFIISCSYASPYYLLEDAKYNYIGFILNMNEFGSIGLSRFHFNYGEDQIFEKLYTSLFTLTYSSNFSHNFFGDIIFGVNINFLKHEIEAKFPHFNTFINVKMDSKPIDIGILKKISFNNRSNINQQLMIGTSVFNINSAKIGIKEKYALPVIFRVGATYALSYLNRSIFSNLELCNFMLTTEYQDLFNSENRTAFRLGGELMFFDIFAVRFGYYNESVDDRGLEVDVDELEEITYGIGVQLPFNKISNNKFPFDLKFDFTSLRQPSYVKSYDKWDNFKVYSVNLQWHFLN